MRSRFLSCAGERCGSICTARMPLYLHALIFLLLALVFGLAAFSDPRAEKQCWSVLTALAHAVHAVQAEPVAVAHQNLGADLPTLLRDKLFPHALRSVHCTGRLPPAAATTSAFAFSKSPRLRFIDTNDRLSGWMEPVRDPLLRCNLN